MRLFAALSMLAALSGCAFAPKRVVLDWPNATLEIERKPGSPDGP